ncbi:uncharacterized protein [Amphiura filiformis]|uniref:uncharacterized protein n=1 Tax=Amphiura filiformis TaxID=82378 RepID=UPI003B21AB64
MASGVSDVPKQQNRPHSDSIDSGFDSLHSVKSETDMTKMLTNDMKDHQAFSDWLKGKLTGHVDGTMIAGKNFVGALLTDIGGNLIIRGIGVHLYVPPGALQKQQFVYIRMLPPSLSSGPQLQEEETCLSPIIECGPPGLKFKKKVYLSIPHCASSGVWKFTVHEDNQQSQQESWTTIEPTETNIKNANRAFTFEIVHFTRYTVSGSKEEDEDEMEAEDEITAREIGFKWMKPVVSMRCMPGHMDGTPSRYAVKVQLCNVEDAQELDASSTQSFQVRDTKEDMTLTLSLTDKKSNIIISGDSQQKYCTKVGD